MLLIDKTLLNYYLLLKNLFVRFSKNIIRIKVNSILNENKFKKNWKGGKGLRVNRIHNLDVCSLITSTSRGSQVALSSIVISNFTIHSLFMCSKFMSGPYYPYPSFHESSIHLTSVYMYTISYYYNTFQFDSFSLSKPYNGMVQKVQT